MSEEISAKRIRERVLADAKAGQLELTDTEQELLDRACYLATVVEEIDSVVAEEGLTIKSPQAGIRVHPLVPERRTTIALMHRLIDQIQLDPSKVGESMSDRNSKNAKVGHSKHPAKPRKAAS